MSTLFDTVKDLKRFKQIVSLVMAAGYEKYLQRMEIRHLVPLQNRVGKLFKRQPSTTEIEEPDTVRLKKLLMDLGPTFIKFGQILSVRTDLLPVEYCQEFAKLTDQVDAFPFEQARQIVETEFHRPLNQLFKDFATTPIAAASLSVVYKARTLNNQEVAVKVRRPGIEQTICRDLEIMRFLARAVDEKIPEFRFYRLPKIVDEFADTILRELDFSLEAINARHFAKMFENDPTVKVAGVLNELSGKSVLTMEFISGIKVDNLPALQAANINRKVLAQNGVNCFMRQVLAEGFFHADPHPGNYWALPGSVFCFLDYGMIGIINARNRRLLAGMFLGFLNNDSEAIISHFRQLVEIDTASDFAKFENDIQLAVNEWYGAKIEDVSFAKTLVQISQSGQKNRIYFPPQFSMLIKSLLALEAMGKKLDPEFNLVAQMEGLMKNILSQELNPLHRAKQLQGKALDYADYAENFPETLYSFFNKINQGELNVKLNPMELKDLEIKLNQGNFKRLIMTVIIAEVFTFVLMFLAQNNLLRINLTSALYSTALLTLLLYIVQKI